MSIFPAKSRFRRRHKRCYELAWKTLFDLNDAGKADGVTLVHGTVASPAGGFPIEHAWLEGGGEAYDAVDHVTMPVAQYVAERGAVAERRYTLKEACARPERYFGPWHESETVKEAVKQAKVKAGYWIDDPNSPSANRVRIWSNAGQVGGCSTLEEAWEKYQWHQEKVVPNLKKGEKELKGRCWFFVGNEMMTVERFRDLMQKEKREGKG
jgi:hypothetical protein